RRRPSAEARPSPRRSTSCNPAGSAPATATPPAGPGTIGSSPPPRSASSSPPCTPAPRPGTPIRRRGPDAAWTPEEVAAVAEAELKDGDSVDLGIGMPALVANNLPPGVNVTLQSENGVMGMGPWPYGGEEDPDLINAGKQTITLLPGATIFDSATSFGMI